MTWKRSPLITLGSARRGRQGARWRRPAVIAAALVVLVPAALAAIGLLRAGSPPPLRLSRAAVEIEGTRLAFHQVGRGPDVLLVHGGMGTAEDWEPVLTALAQSHRVTAIDRPGFGGSTAPGASFSISGNAHLLAELIRRQGLVRPIVVGHSHGGGVALRLALDAPERIGGLVLLAAAAYPNGGASVTDRVLALPRVGEGLAFVMAGIAKGQIEDLLVAGLGPDAARGGPDFISWRVGTWNTPLSLTTHARQNVTDDAERALIAPRYPTLRLPAAVAWCEQDPWEAQGSIQSVRLARELSAREVRLAGCGHYVQLGRPDAVVDAVNRVGSRHAPPPGASEPSSPSPSSAPRVSTPVRKNTD